MPYQPRLIRVTRDGTCDRCRRAVTSGEIAWWTRGEATVTCLTCLPATAGYAPPNPGKLAATGLDSPSRQPPADHSLAASALRSEGDPDIDLGTAGRSAMDIYQRRHGNREERIRERWGRLAGLVLALSDDPQSTRAWQRGSGGETKLAKTLVKLDREDVIVLHDRRVPGSRGNIDHLVICPTGVYVC